MNRIYSKAWNPKLGQLVVASELASRDGMGAAGAGHVRARARGALALAVLMALGGLSGSAFALDAVCVDPNDLGTTVGDASASGDQVACGQGAVAVGTNAIAVGANARSSGTAAMAIGVDAQAIAIRATALGYNSVARAQDSLAIGGATANAQRSIAMGQNAVAGLSSTGTANMVAIGAGATARAAASVALGSGASTGSDDGGGSYAIAIGGNSQAVANGGVAIGYNARALSPVENLNLLIGSVAIGRDAMTSGTYATALGDSAQATGNHSMAMGHRAGATQEDATAYGHGARAEGLGSLAVGGAGGGGFSAVGARAVGENSVAIGSVSLAQGESSIALGDRARATGIHSLSMGNRNVVAGNRSGALGELNNIGGNDSYAVGNNNVVHADTSEAFILGNNVNLGAGVNRAVALGHGTGVTVAGGVALGATSVASVAGGAEGLIPLGASASDIAAIQATNSTVLGAVSVGTGAAGGNRQIVNVAAGTNDSDAVNVAQLKAVSGLATAGWDVTDANGNTANIGPGGEVRFESGNTNLTVTQMGDDDEGVVQVTLGNDLNLTAAGSVTTGQTVLSNTGVAVGANVVLGNTGLVIAGGPSVTATGINAGGQAITGVLAGVNGTDAVNVNQLNSTVGTALSSATWNVKDANGNTANIGPGGEVRFESGNTNLMVTQTGDDDEGVVEITLGNDLNLTAAGSVTTGQTVMNNSGVAVGANVVLGTSGLTVAGGPVTTAVTGSGLTTGTVVVSGANNSVTGLSNTTLAVPGFATAGRAATEEQLLLVRGEIGAGIEANKTKYYSVNSTGGGNEDNDGANGTDAIAAGKDAAADGDESVALGLGASASGDRGVALGAGAQAQSLDSLAIGSGAVAGHANSIALGAGSATTVGARASYQGAFVGNSSSTGEMNVGGRQVTGVAAGSAATDAVNVSQLQAGVDHAITEAKDYTDSQMGNLNAGLSDLDNRVGAVEGDLIDIRGDITQIQGDIVDIQGDITNLDQRVSQIGDSMGDLASTVNGFESRVTELENRGTGPVRVTQGETYEVPVVSGTNALGGGNGAAASGDNSVALGNQAVASANNSTAIGQGAVASHGNSVALGQGSATTIGAQAGYNAAYVGRSNSTGEVNVGGRTLSGVAPGIAGTDAVNVNQLTAGVSHAIDQANQYTENRLNQMQGDVWSVNRSYRGATASAMAMAGIPQAYVPGKSMLAVGFGGYQSEYGMAVGLSGITVDGRWVYKAQASGNTSRDWGFSMGAGIQW